MFSALSASDPQQQAVAGAVIGETSETLRGWLFCLAFVSIGLETNFRELSRFLVGGKPLILYFYPNDNTQGCTTEGQRFRDLYP